MRRTLVLLTLLGFSIALFGLVSACSKQPTSATPGTIRLQMTDAPGAYDAVNIEVTEVSAHFAGSGDAGGAWEVLTGEPDTYDLLTLRNGVFATLAIAQVPAGHYTQIRLKLGPGSNVVVDGVPHPLVVPSGMQSGYKLVGEFDVPPGGLVDLQLDFDAARSVVQTGAGTYRLKPTARVMPFSTAGAIHGTVSPAGTAVDVYAIQGPDTVGTTSAATDGDFQVSVLPAGTYALAFHPEAGFRDTTLADIGVTAGATTEVGTVALTPVE